MTGFFLFLSMMAFCGTQICVVLLVLLSLPESPLRELWRTPYWQMLRALRGFGLRNGHKAS